MTYHPANLRQRPDPSPNKLAREPWIRVRPKNPAAPFVPTEHQRQKVRAMAAVGVPQDQIALVLRVDPKTLRRHFRIDLDTAAAEANAQVGGRLFKLAMEGNPIACIFWAKARMGWVDRREVDHKHTMVTSTLEERLAALERDPDDDGPAMIEHDPNEGGPGPDEQP